ncbi:MAG TPA: hypothetical protein PKM04_07710, partial [Accumulibacter sp.]|nr:hypothetical protein [Accumulibacter sp.]
TWPQLGALAAFLATGFAAYAAVGENLPWLNRIQDVQRVVLLVGLMSLASFFGISNFMFGVAGLNAMQQRSYLFRAILATAACSLAACFTLGWLHGELGAAVSFVLAELCLFALIVRKYIL